MEPRKRTLYHGAMEADTLSRSHGSYALIDISRRYEFGRSIAVSRRQALYRGTTKADALSRCHEGGRSITEPRSRTLHRGATEAEALSRSHGVGRSIVVPRRRTLSGRRRHVTVIFIVLLDSTCGKCGTSQIQTIICGTTLVSDPFSISSSPKDV